MPEDASILCRKAVLSARDYINSLRQNETPWEDWHDKRIVRAFDQWKRATKAALNAMQSTDEPEGEDA